MKRIKVATNRFLSLYRTETDCGTTAAFEITRSTDHPNPMIATFRPDAQFPAQRAVKQLTDAMTHYGPN